MYMLHILCVYFIHYVQYMHTLCILHTIHAIIYKYYTGVAYNGCHTCGGERGWPRSHSKGHNYDLIS